MKKEKKNYYGPSNGFTSEHLDHNIPPFYDDETIENKSKPDGVEELRDMITPQLKTCPEYDVCSSLDDLLIK